MDCNIAGLPTENGVVFGDVDSGGTNNRLENCTIRNSQAGVYLELTSGNHITGNIFFNLTGEGVRVETGSNEIINNTFNLTGNAFTQDKFYISNSTFIYDGVAFDGNGMNPRLYNSALNQYVEIDSADKDVSARVTGSYNFSLWLIDLPDAGVRNWTLYVEQPNGMTCAAVAAAYSGTCYLDFQDFYTENGPANYTSNKWDNITIISGTQDPNYLRYNPYENQTNAPIHLSSADSNNITGNRIWNGSNTIYSSIVISPGSDSNNVWLNNFYYAGVGDMGADNSYCVGNEGNFYWENLAPVTGDCGPVSYTVPAEGEEYGGLLNITWQEQSSANPVNYSLYYSNDSGVNYHYIDSVAGLSYMWDVPNAAQTNITLKIVPFDGFFNATNVFVSFIKNQLDVLNLSLLYGSSVYTIFEFVIKNIDIMNNTASWLFAPGSGERNITGNSDIDLTPGEDIFVYIERNYSSTGTYNATAYANSSLSDDEELVEVSVG